MSEMVERVARAMCAVEGDPWDELNEDASATGIQYVFTRADWRRFARAALAAIREPTEAMIAAAHDEVWEFNPDYAPLGAGAKGEGSAAEIAAAAWRAMASAALAEQPPPQPRDAAAGGR